MDVFFLVGDDARGPAPNAGVTTEQRFAVLGAVLLEFAAVHEAGNDLPHIVLLGGVAGENSVDFFGRIKRIVRGDVTENRRIGRADFVGKGPDTFEARLVIRFAKVHRAADLRVHFGAAELFSGRFLADGSLHQRGTCEKQARAFGHKDVIAHNRQIRAAGYAHAHDRGDLRNAHGRHDRVVAEDPAEIVGIGKDVFLQWEKNARRVDQVDRRNPVFDGDVLRANDFFRCHREERAGFYRRVVCNDHEEASADAGETGDGSGGRRAAPFFVHFKSREGAEFKKVGAGIDQLGDTFAGSQTPFLVLGLDGFAAAALADDFVLILDLGEKVDYAARIFLEVGRVAIDGGFQSRSGHAAPSRLTSLSI